MRALGLTMLDEELPELVVDLIATLVAWPYRHIAHYRRGVFVGALLATFAVMNIVVGAFR